MIPLLNMINEYFQNYKSHKLIEYMKDNGFNYLVMEDLDIKSNKTKTLIIF